MRWAIMSFVVPGISSAKAFLILASVAVSQALVESSRMRILGFLRSALAMQSLCLCPPETLVPPCSITVLYPSFILSMNSSAHAMRQALLQSSRLALGSPQRRLSRMVPEKSTFFCRTTDTWSRSISMS